MVIDPNDVKDSVEKAAIKKIMEEYQGSEIRSFNKTSICDNVTYETVIVDEDKKCRNILFKIDLEKMNIQTQ